MLRNCAVNSFGLLEIGLVWLRLALTGSFLRAAAKNVDTFSNRLCAALDKSFVSIFIFFLRKRNDRIITLRPEEYSDECTTQ